MNRLHHLQQTLPANLAGNAPYQNLEFILLDYNSTDGLGGYIGSAMREYLDNGMLVYYRTMEPRHFHRSHSRNLAFRLATGDVLCNLDADNFTANDFARYINAIFCCQENVFLSAIEKDKSHTRKDVLGRICVPREKFLAIKGYDEGMQGYGFEDYDLVNRLEMLGSRRLPILQQHLQAIDHPDEERIAEEYTTKHCRKVLINHLTAWASEFIFLFDNTIYCRGTVQDNRIIHSTDLERSFSSRSSEYQFDLAQQQWALGNWAQEKEALLLTGSDGPGALVLLPDGKYRSRHDGRIFHSLDDAGLHSQAVFFHSQISNRIRMKQNSLGRLPAVNQGKFGTGTVYRNFDFDNPIII